MFEIGRLAANPFKGSHKGTFLDAGVGLESLGEVTVPVETFVETGQGSTPGAKPCSPSFFRVRSS